VSQLEIDSDVLAVQNLHELDVRAIREAGVGFDQRAVATGFLRCRVLRENDAVGIADCGRTGRTIEKAFDSRDDARACYDKLLQQKIGTGYSEVGGQAVTKKSRPRKKVAKSVATLRWPKGKKHTEWSSRGERSFPPQLGYSTLHQCAYGSGDEMSASSISRC
jgi:hypothetical protein